MANKQAKMQATAKGVLIEQPEAQKHGQPTKVRPIKKRKHMKE